HGTVTGEGADRTVEHHVAGDQAAHHFQHPGQRLGVRVVVDEAAVVVARDVEVGFADVIDLVVLQWIVVRILQAFAREHHDRSLHAGHDVPGRHGAARCAVVHVHARTVGLEAQGRLLARGDEGDVSTAHRTGGGAEVDVVHHRVAGRADQRDFDVVALEHTQHRDG